MKCSSLVILVLIFNQVNGYILDCLQGVLTCIIKDARNVTELDRLTGDPWKENHLKFENSSLDVLHPNMFTSFPGLLILDASGLQLKTIDKEQFNSASQLERLILSNNSLTMFNTSFLSRLNKLHSLDVSNNKIKNFDFEALKKNNINLKNLNVSHNIMTNIVISENLLKLVASNNSLEHIIVPMNSKLKHLDLSGNILLSNVKKNMKHLQSIEHLNVRDVLLEPLEIDLFVEMEKLQTLILRNTGITKIEYGTFSNLQDLLILDLSYNKITDLDVHMLLVLRNLTSLYISGNKIVTFNLFQSAKPLIVNLKEISIEQNNWECLHLAKFYSTLVKNKIEVVKLQHPKKDSTNVMFIECSRHQESTLITSTTEKTETTETTTLKIEDFTTTETSNQENNQLISQDNNDDSAFYKVLSSIAITLLLVCILLKLKKYIKFHYCQSYKMADEKELREPSTEMV